VSQLPRTLLSIGWLPLFISIPALPLFIMFSRAIAQQQLPSLPSRPSCTAKLLSSSSFVVPSRNDSYKKDAAPTIKSVVPIG
jgi:hypothetical protein